MPEHEQVRDPGRDTPRAIDDPPVQARSGDGRGRIP
jgi:hypothetical protein